MSEIPTFRILIADATPPEPAEWNFSLGLYLLDILPLLVVVAALFWILNRLISGPRAKKTELYLQRHIQHMENVESTLARIADALEVRKRDGN